MKIEDHFMIDPVVDVADRVDGVDDVKELDESAVRIFHELPVGDPPEFLERINEVPPF